MFFKKNPAYSSLNTKSGQPMLEKDDDQHEHWLAYLYRESWQQELLIIGITLFLLFQVPKGIDHLHDIIIQVYYTHDLIVASLFIALFTLKASSYVLIFNLLTDLFLRGVWIGLIGLSSAFPEGIRENKFHYHESMKRVVFGKMVPPKRSIIKLDKVCSIIFSFTFLIIFYIFSLSLFIFLLLMMVFGIQYTDGHWSLFFFIALVVVYVVAALLYFLDFVLFGGLRRFKWTAKPFRYIYLFFSYVTLSFFYKNIYYTLVSNIKKRYLIPVLAFYLIVSASLVGNLNHIIERGGATSIKPIFYDNLREKDVLIEVASIPADQIKGNWLKVFANFDLARKTIRHFCAEYDEEDREILNTRPRIDRDNFKCLRQVYHLKLNDQVLDSLDWLYQIHPNMEEKGFVVNINMEHLPPGLHRLQVLRPSLNKQDSLIYQTSCTIPFWKE